MRRLVPFLRREKGLLALTLLCASLNQVLLLAEPQILRLIIDGYALEAHQLTPAAFVAGTGGLIVLSVGLAFAARLARTYQTYCSGVVARRVASRSFSAMVEQSMFLPYSCFEEVASGERLQRLQKVRADVQALLANATVPVLAALALLAVTFYAFTLHWMLGVALVVLPGALAMVLIPLSAPLKRQQRQIANQLAALSGAASEAFANADLIKSFGVEREQFQRLSGQTALLLDLETQQLRLERRYSFLEGTLLNGGRALVLFLALWLLRQGSLTPGQLVTMFLYSLSIFSPIAQLGDMIVRVHETRLNLEAAGGIVAGGMQGAPARPATHDPLPPIRSVALEDVSFQYPTAATPALQHITLRVGAGEIVALVGASGSGKSSVVKLLAGLYPPSAGQIVVNGVPMDTDAVSALRQRIGVVTQETRLFVGTVRDNLLLARPDATDAECLEALHAAAVPAIVRRGRAGLAMRIGEGGLRLSGGERQRLCIARALLRRPEILVLDEATGMLDARTEWEIIETIKRVSAESSVARLTLIISHRSAVAAIAHRVYVLAGGRIAGEGSHGDLLARCGPYAALWQNHAEAGWLPRSG